jgi:hypothetical protein
MQFGLFYEDEKGCFPFHYVHIAGHGARMGRRGMPIGYWWESQKERNHWEDQDIGRWTILKWILKR